MAASRLLPSLWVQLGLFLLCSGTFYRKEDCPVVTEHEAVPGLAKQDLCSASGCKKYLQHYLRWQFGPPCSLRFATNSNLRSGASKQVLWENGSKYFCLQFEKRKRKKKKSFHGKKLLLILVDEWCYVVGGQGDFTFLNGTSLVF